MMSQLIDGLMLLLLVGTLGYAFLVDRRVRKLMAALAELEPVVGRFSEAVDKSEGSVSALRSATEDMSEANSRASTAGRVGLVRKRASARSEAPQHAEPASEHRPEPKLRKPQPAQPAPERPQPQRRMTQPIPGGKTDLVRQFFETTRSSEA